MSGAAIPLRDNREISPVERLRALLAELMTTPIESIPDLLAELERVKVTLSLRAFASPASPPEMDRLLTAVEAAKVLNVAEDWLYRHADGLPFVVRLGPRVLRFSANAIEKFIVKKLAKR